MSLETGNESVRRVSVPDYQFFPGHEDSQAIVVAFHNNIHPILRLQFKNVRSCDSKASLWHSAHLRYLAPLHQDIPAKNSKCIFTAMVFRRPSSLFMKTNINDFMCSLTFLGKHGAPCNEFVQNTSLPSSYLSVPCTQAHQ